MSEYQYFEFHASDRPLTREQIAELRRYSTRAEIDSTRFVNEYHWGDFKGDPKRWMAEYFDAFLHFANWGTHWLMLRLPGELLAAQSVREYESEDCLEAWRQGGHTIVSFLAETEEPDGTEMDYSLAPFLPLRAALIRGDRRSLYLAWLAGIGKGTGDEDDEDKASPELEPPVPPGLATLDGPHQLLAEFLRVAPDLIAVAAERSASLDEARPDPAAIERWVRALPAADKDSLLVELLLAETHYPIAALKQRLDLELRAVAPASNERAGRRTVGELLARAATVARERKERATRERAVARARQAAEAAERRRRHLDSLCGREDSHWQTVAALIGTRQPASYAQAVDMLRDLRELAGLDDRSADFRARMGRLREEHAKKPALIRRFGEAGLLD